MMTTIASRPVKSAIEAKWIGMGPAWNGERRLVGCPLQSAHARGEDRLHNAHHAEHQRNQKQAGLEVPLDGGNNQSEEDRTAAQPKIQKNAQTKTKASDMPMALLCPTSKSVGATPAMNRR